MRHYLVHVVLNGLTYQTLENNQPTTKAGGEIDQESWEPPSIFTKYKTTVTSKIDILNLF